MKFKVKDMDIATGGPLVATLHEKDARKLDLHVGDRIIIKDHPTEITCILDIASSEKVVQEGQVGLFDDVVERLHLHKGSTVEIKFTGKPESVAHIRDKLNGKRLRYEELYHIVDDITHDRLTDIEKTYFVAACYTNGLNNTEIVDLTKAMVETGKRLSFPGVVLDKHCVGGVPGNRTTMIVIPIIAAAGFTIPKTSSRAITSPAGTADTMECLAQVELTEKKIKEVVRTCGACIVHGGAMSLAPADDKIIEVEHPLSIDAEGQLLASVMAKKYSVGASHVLIDIPMGKSTKANSKSRANHLQKMFEMVGRSLNMDVNVVITDGSRPIGRGVGPLLEANDVMSVLRNDADAPKDLKKKAIFMAGALLEMTGKFKNGAAAAIYILESGRAYVKMNQIIAAQGKQKIIPPAEFTHKVRSFKVGRITAVDNEVIAKIARMAGAPHDKAAGLYLHLNVGDKVRKGDLLYTIHAESEFKLALAKEFAKRDRGFEVH